VAAYIVVKAIKPDPIHQAAVTKGEPVTAYFNARTGEVAEALLKSAYEKLRPTAKKHVEAAVPRIGRLDSKYAASAQAASAAPPTA
jgi:hypothetical protein